MKKRSIVWMLILVIIVSLCPGCGRRTRENAGENQTEVQPTPADIAGTIVQPERYLPEQREIKWTRRNVVSENELGIKAVDAVETGVVTRDIYGRKIGSVYRSDTLMGIRSWQYDENGRLLSETYREYGYVSSDLAKAPEDRAVFANGYEKTTYRYDELGRLVEEISERCYFGFPGSPDETALRNRHPSDAATERSYREYVYEQDTNKVIHEKWYSESKELGKHQIADFVYGDGAILLESWEVDVLSSYAVIGGAYIDEQDDLLYVIISTEKYDAYNRRGTRDRRFENLHRSTLQQDYAKLLENPYEYGDHPMVMDGGSSGYTVYDASGQIIESSFSSSWGSETVKYDYDENGRRTRAEYRSSYRAEEPAMSYDLYYEEPGIAGEITCQVLNETQTSKDYKVRMFTGQTPHDYEEQDVLFKIERYQDKQSDQIRYTSEFDEQGRLRSVLITKADDGYIQQDTYDENGFLVERKAWDASGEFLHTTLTFEY